MYHPEESTVQSMHKDLSPTNFIKTCNNEQSYKYQMMMPETCQDSQTCSLRIQQEKNLVFANSSIYLDENDQDASYEKTLDNFKFSNYEN